MTQAKARSPRHWRGNVRYNNNPVLREYSGGTFAQIRTEMVADLPDSYRLRKTLETDSFIEYDIIHAQMNASERVGVAEIEEMRGE